MPQHQHQHISAAAEQPCTAEQLLQILADLRAPRLQGFTLDDFQRAPPRPWPPYADRGIHPMRLPLKTKCAVLWRLADRQYARWHKSSLPIAEDDYFIYRLWRELEEAGRALDLPQIYAVLARRFGPNSDYTDDWKEGFKIPLLLGLEHLGETIFYSLTVAQWKAGIEVRFRRQHLGVEHLDRDVYQQPFEAELPREQLNQCAGFILQYCTLAYYAAPESFVWDFHFAVPAAQIAFGCLNGQFYLWQARGERDFEKHARKPKDCARLAPSLNRKKRASRSPACASSSLPLTPSAHRC